MRQTLTEIEAAEDAGDSTLTELRKSVRAFREGRALPPPQLDYLPSTTPLRNVPPVTGHNARPTGHTPRMEDSSIPAVRARLEQAVFDGEADAKLLAYFDVHPQEALNRCSLSLRKSLGLEATEGDLMDSDIVERLQLAALDGALPAKIIAIFDHDRTDALRRIDAQVKKRYGIPAD